LILIYINEFFFSFKFLFCWILGFWRLYFGFNWWIDLNVMGWLLWVMSYLVDFERF
jgi:hypothetical protein